MREPERLFSLKFLEAAAASGSEQNTELAPDVIRICIRCGRPSSEVPFKCRGGICRPCTRRKTAENKAKAASYGMKPNIELKGNIK